MIDGATREVWVHRVLFVVLALVFMFFRLLPLGEAAEACAPDDSWCRLWDWLGQMPGPDLLLCIILAWMMRRPDYLPVLLIAAVVLAEDLILLRPPGLWTALVVLVSEIIRSRVALTRELNFSVEWLLVSALMVAMLIVYRMAFGLVLVAQPPFGFAMVQVVWSILCYPVVVFLSRVVLDLYKPAMGEVDAYGRRL
ncbi:MAG: rod shape-determining protein MreD [Pseudorhodobacter sp.]|nr:MAG: rod shape-determining protein MreD [Pseudorhodobacter sp.]